MTADPTGGRALPLAWRAMLRLVAHQGGWDEAIVLVGPVVLFALVRFLDRRRPPAPPAPSSSASSPAETSDRWVAPRGATNPTFPFVSGSTSGQIGW